MSHTIQGHSFTIKSTGGLLKSLTCQIEIFQPGTPISTRIAAIWDTGASSTVITEDVVRNLGLVPTGMVQNHTAGGTINSNTYLVSIGLPNKVKINGVSVSSVPRLSGGKIDALIGMDIITMGDFSITNYQGHTCMTFRIPSLHEIDYTSNPNLILKPMPFIAPPKIQKNSLCTCGSGRKFKNCCGQLP